MTFPEPRTTPLKAPAKKKPAARKATAKTKSAPKDTKPAGKKAAPKRPAAKKAATKKVAPKKASAPKAKADGKPVMKRFRAAPKPEAAHAPAVVLPEIPAELLQDGPKPKKARKPRGKKASAPKPKGALNTILAQLDDAKAEQIVTIPLADTSSVADAVVVASGRSNRHVGAIADQLVQKLKHEGHRDLRVEGMPQCDWVLVDAGDVIVHIFRPEVRSFYNLEKLLSAHSPEEWSAQ